MRTRWLIWTAGIALIALIGLFPLRLGLAWSDFDRVGFTARQTAGTIWYGRIGDLQLRSQPLGTFEVSLNPFALLLGKARATFNRLDSSEGPLEGRLVLGTHRGLEGTSGRLAVGNMFAPLPVEAIELRDITVMFRRGRCVEASGEVRPIMAASIPGLDLGSRLSGRIACDGERARVTMPVAGNVARFEFYVHASGSYRGWISVRNPFAGAAAGLNAFGFRPSPEGLTLSVDGTL